MYVLCKVHRARNTISRLEARGAAEPVGEEFSQTKRRRGIVGDDWTDWVALFMRFQLAIKSPKGVSHLVNGVFSGARNKEEIADRTLVLKDRTEPFFNSWAPEDVRKA